MDYHRILRIVSTESIELECPACCVEMEVRPHDSKVECDLCTTVYGVVRTAGVASLDDSDDDGDDWKPPPKLYHGTSLKRFKEMLASPKSFELYLADNIDGTGMYAETASAEDESPPVTIVFDTDKLASSPAAGQLWPDWDDVDMMITGGDTDADGSPLFGDADGVRDVSWMDSLRIINTCSYEGDFSGAIIEVLLDNGKVAKPPFGKLTARTSPTKLYHGMFGWNAEDDRTASKWWLAAREIGEVDAEQIVSFDFDDVLHYAPGGNPIDFWEWESWVPREPYVSELRRLASDGHRIIVVSYRDPGMEKPVMSFAAKHGLKIDAVHCVGVYGSKLRVLEEEDATIHYDDSPSVADELRGSDIELVEVPRTGEADLSWVPDAVREQHPDIYKGYMDTLSRSSSFLD